MRVLVLAPPMAGVGGIQRYTATLIRALKDLLGDESVRCVALPEMANGSRHGRFSAGLKLRFGWQAAWEATRWRPDLIICTHLALGPVGQLLSNLRRRPYWIVVYGIEAWAVLPWWKRGALRQADHVIAISAFSREQVVNRHQIDGKRISSLPCTLDENLLRSELTKPGTFARFAEGRRLVLTVGRMAASERYKGHDVALRALPSVLVKIPNLTYLIVGDGDDRPRLEGLVQELGLTQHAVFTGEVTESELAALYNRSEVFLLPARTVIDDHNPKGEGFGIVFLEAMAFGKPVIGPNYGAPVELIRHGEFGLLVDPEDPAAVADALIQLLSAPEEAKSMGELASRWVRQEYSFASLCRRLGELLADSGYVNFNQGGALESTGASRSGSPGGHP